MKLNEAKSLVTRENEAILRSLHLLPEQCVSVLEEASFFDTKKLISPKNIVVCGMGGSALGAHVVRSVFGEKIKVPFLIINNYSLPNFVDKNTLVILSSYSGNTEEVLGCFESASKRKAKITVLTSGGKLKNIAKRKKLPLLVFDTKDNPSETPRTGLGYSIFGIIRILETYGVLKVDKKNINNALKKLKYATVSWGVDVPFSNNKAKEIAKEIAGKIPVVIGSDFLVGNLHIFQNQIHETSKNFGMYFELPEINHHLMEGLSNPKDKNLVFLFIESNLYHSRNKKRYTLTKEVVKKNKIKVLEYKLSSKDKLSGTLEVLVLGSFVSFYLSVLNNENPVKNPWVDWFKKRLM